ncbi:MAG TPA: clostripain-related cysteine peptidase [Blastocatellia bacterium]|nr:clostripain-related cysteine peptidase [Blastocatellia bacterium]
MPKKSATKQWTVMVYMAGDNNLDSAGVADLKEMKKVGSTGGLNIIAQFDRAGEGLETKRYCLSKGGALEKDLVAKLGETNTGDPKTLEGFIRWGITNYPAEHYLVVLWNHGAGWDDTDIYHTARSRMKLNITRKGEVADHAPGRAAGSVPINRIRAIGNRRLRRALFRPTVEQALRKRAIAFDDNAQDFLDNVEIKKVLTSVGKSLKRRIDILGMDACLMSMIEVAWQVRDSVANTVGSEQTEPGDGWPYDAILGELAKKPRMTPRELAGVIVKKYIASYPSSEPVTQAAFDLSHAAPLTAAVDRLAKTLISSLSTPAERLNLMQARAQVQTYEVDDYIDLLDLCQLVSASTGRAEVKAACQGVIDAATTGGFLIESGFKGKKMENSRGISIYFPTKEISPLYAKLDFVKKTAWGKFLATYLSGTSRRRLVAAAAAS